MLLKERCEYFPFNFRVDSIYDIVDEILHADVTMTTSPAYEEVQIK